MKIGVIGAGRLGICFALLMEKAGYDILVSDIRENYVNDLNNKKIITNEPHVQELLSNSKKIVATTDNKKVIEECDIIFTLVATPSLPDGSYDVSSVWEVIDDIQNSEKSRNKLFVVGCTTNPGDCEKFQEELLPYSVDVLYNPEFIAQGSIINDLENADMVLIGGNNPSNIEKIKEIYYKIQINKPNICTMSPKAGEITKIAINCFLTSKISFANMIGEVMCLSGMEDEVSDVLTAIGSDTRIGGKYLKYGYGFGGPCFPRDNRSFASYAESVGCQFNIGRTTDNFNKKHVEFLKNYFINKNSNNEPYYFDYISYKKGTDILIESQQYQLCLELLNSGYVVYVNDIESVVEQVKESLENKFYDRIRFVKDESELPEKILKIKF
jgi:nucleotide sugar dehydrogenase